MSPMFHTPHVPAHRLRRLTTNADRFKHAQRKHARTAAALAAELKRRGVGLNPEATPEEIEKVLHMMLRAGVDARLRRLVREYVEATEALRMWSTGGAR